MAYELIRAISPIVWGRIASVLTMAVSGVSGT